MGKLGTQTNEQSHRRITFRASLRNKEEEEAELRRKEHEERLKVKQDLLEKEFEKQILQQNLQETTTKANLQKVMTLSLELEAQLNIISAQRLSRQHHRVKQ